MPALLLPIVLWFVGSVVARVLVGAGLAIASHVWISEYITDALNFISGGLLSTGTAGSLLWMAGVGEGLSIVGAALIAKATFEAARVFIVRSA